MSSVKLFAITALVALIVLIALVAGPHRGRPFASETAPSVALHAGSELRFAPIAEARRILGARDVFVRAMSPFDRQARMRTAAPVDEKSFLKFAAAQALAWSPGERKRLRKAIAAIRPRLKWLPAILPEAVFLVKTTGKEEGAAAHCRGLAIVLPEKVLGRDSESLESLLLHELFHVLSRHRPKLRDALYAQIGFERVDAIELPASIRDRKLTNPDAPLVNVVLRAPGGGKASGWTPVLYSSSEKFNPREGGTFFRYLTFRFMRVEKRGGRWEFAERNGAPHFVTAETLPEFYENAGRNTDYIIHPEEILADNFVFAINGKRSLPSPEVVAALKERLQAASVKEKQQASSFATKREAEKEQTP